MSNTARQVMHVVLLQWNQGTAPETVERAFHELRALKGVIPGVLELTCGANFTDRAKGYTHGIVVLFANRAALDAYLPHPEHQRVVQEFINPIRADALAMDYEL